MWTFLAEQLDIIILILATLIALIPLFTDVILKKDINRPKKPYKRITGAGYFCLTMALIIIILTMVNKRYTAGKVEKEKTLAENKAKVEKEISDSNLVKRLNQSLEGKNLKYDIRSNTIYNIENNFVSKPDSNKPAAKPNPVMEIQWPIEVFGDDNEGSLVRVKLKNHSAEAKALMITGISISSSGQILTTYNSPNQEDIPYSAESTNEKGIGARLLYNQPNKSLQYLKITYKDADGNPQPPIRTLFAVFKNGKISAPLSFTNHKAVVDTLKAKSYW